MPAYKIVIPLDGNKNFSSGGNNADFSVDRGVSRSAQFRVLTAKFGDGYEQRVRDGINEKQETFSVSFKNRGAKEIYAIADYLDFNAAGSFDFYIDNDTVKVTCEAYDIVHLYEDAYSLSTQFRRVYEV